jgi:hypothetical protein
LASLGIGGPSKDPITHANQCRKEKTRVEGYVLGDARKKRNSSRVSVIVTRVGIISWFMESFGPFL